HIRASSHNGCIQRPNTWLHPNVSRKGQILFPCTAGAVHTWLHPNVSRKGQILFPCTAGAVHTWHIASFHCSAAITGDSYQFGRVGMWRGGCRLNISVAAPFVWRCLSGSTLAPFPHSAHRTGQADLPHPALGQDLTPLFDVRRHLRFPNPLWSL